MTKPILELTDIHTNVTTADGQSIEILKGLNLKINSGDFITVIGTNGAGKSTLFNITGIFFSQGYGELYYEIYLGNHKNLAHGAWFGNYFSLDNLATADLRFGATSLRIGYHNTILSTSVNHIVTRMTTHSFVLGVSGEWLGFDSRRGLSTPTRIISAIY